MIKDQSVPEQQIYNIDKYKKRIRDEMLLRSKTIINCTSWALILHATNNNLSLTLKFIRNHLVIYHS